MSDNTCYVNSTVREPLERPRGSEGVDITCPGMGKPSLTGHLNIPLQDMAKPELPRHLNIPRTCGNQS